MIHVDTGEIDLAQGVRVGPSFTEAEFLRSALSRNSKAQNDPEWSRYKIQRQLISGLQFRVGLCFHRGRLEQIELFLVGAESKASWDEWSEREEVERKASHDAWLDALLGPPPYAFAWGEISSDYDPKGGYSCIMVSYAPRARA
jgi:hypothetical protein